MLMRPVLLQSCSSRLRYLRGDVALMEVDHARPTHASAYLASTITPRRCTSLDEAKTNDVSRASTTCVGARASVPVRSVQNPSVDVAAPFNDPDPRGPNVDGVGAVSNRIAKCRLQRAHHRGRHGAGAQRRARTHRVRSRGLRSQHAGDHTRDAHDTHARSRRDVAVVEITTVEATVREIAIVLAARMN